MASRLDPGRRQIGYARWMVLLFGLATPGSAVLLVAGTWSMMGTSKADWWATALFLGIMWVIFIGLLIVPGVWYLTRMWRGVPALQIDAWGLLWGADWSRDLGIEWREIASIGSRRIRSQYYSDRALLVFPMDRSISASMPAIYRWAAWVTREMYGTPFVIGLGTLSIGQDELLALIRGRFDGEIDLGAW